MTGAQLRGLVYSAHADGYTYNRIAAALGITGHQARQIDADTRQLIEREADRWFGPRRALAAADVVDVDAGKTEAS